MKRCFKAVLCTLVITTLFLSACGGTPTTTTPPAVTTVAANQSASTPADAANSSEEWVFDRKIDIICGWGAGGGQDSTIRPMAALLQESLGVPVVVTNVEGANGWNSYDYVNKQPADGYTFCMNTPTLIVLDLMGETPANIDYKNGFVPVCKLVHDMSIVITSKKSSAGKYTTFPEMLDYADKNPGQVSVGMISATGMDAIGFKKAIGDAQINNVSFNGGAEMNAALIGGHIDLAMAGVSEIAGLMESGDVIPLLALTQKKIGLYPDIPISADYGIDSDIGPYRFVMAKKGTPQAAIDALEAAIEKAVETPEWQEFLVNNCFNERVHYENEEAITALIAKDYEVFREYLREEGLLAK